MSTMLAPLGGVALVTLALAVCALLLLTCEVGFQMGRRQARRRPAPEAKLGVTAALAAGMVTLLAFILGLTINFAQNRYDARRDLVVVEANAIGTAFLRARLVGGSEGDALAEEIAAYARTRLEFTRTESEKAAAALIARTGAQQDRIWADATAIARRTPTPIGASLIASLNDMIDSSLSQRFAFEGRVPQDMFALLLVFSVLAVGATGFQLGLSEARQPVLSAFLIVMWTAGMAITVDLNRPRDGDIRVDPSPLIWTIQGFGPPIPSAPPGAPP